jgi:phosphohistidine phosphatase
LDVFLLRHGEAGRKITAGGSDFRRPLTAAGEKEISEIARSIKKIGIKFDAILTSPLKRTQQTADIVAKELKAQKKTRQSKELLPEGNRSDFYRIVGSFKTNASILVVGHSPYLNKMINEIVIDGKPGDIDLKKGGLARITITTVTTSTTTTTTTTTNNTTPKLEGELRWLITPRLMKKMSKI